MSGLDIGIQAESYLSTLRRKGRKESTIICYRNGLRQCFACLMRDHRSTLAEDISTDDVHYLWENLTVKEEVRQGYLRNLAGFVQFYTGRDVVKQADILRNREVRNRVFIDRQDYAVLIHNATPFQRIILVLGGMMGLRRVEMLALTDEDVCSGHLVIHGKGHGNEGLVINAYMPAIVREEIEKYRRWKSTVMPDSGDGFLIQTRSRRGQWSRATPQQVSDAVKELGRCCGIEVTTHSLRRLYATTLYYEIAADLQTVKCLMRHSSVDTTLRCYIQANDTKARTAAREVSEMLRECIDV